ncbi:MAG: YybH family protein [Planctomycetales bacterium]
MRTVVCSVTFLLVGGLLGLTMPRGGSGAPADEQPRDKSAKGAATGAKATKSVPPTGAPDKPPSDAALRETESAIGESAQRFAEAFNRHDPAALVADFIPQAEFITESGQRIQGRDAIEKHFAEVFRAAPQSTIKLHVESIRQFGANAAIEEGVSEMTPEPGLPPTVSRYVVVHVREQGRWRVARARDFDAERGVPHHSHHLRELEWMIGDWLDESSNSQIHTSCRWVDDHNFLLQEFTMDLPERGIVTGSMRIGWDPLTQQFKSWTFDSTGSYSEGLWSHGADAWVIKSQGVSALGQTFSRTAIIRKIDKQTMTLETHDRLEGDAYLGNRAPVTVRRRPPPPAE